MGAMRQFNEFLRAGGLEVLAHEAAAERDEFDREVTRLADRYMEDGRARGDRARAMVLAKAMLTGRSRTESEARRAINEAAKARAESAEGQAAAEAARVRDRLVEVYRSRGMSAHAARVAAEGRVEPWGPDLRGGGRW